jgi:hypothetical protein
MNNSRHEYKVCVPTDQNGVMLILHGAGTVVDNGGTDILHGCSRHIVVYLNDQAL